MPRWMRRLVMRLRALLGRRRADRELDEELRFHLDQLTHAYRSGGMTDAEAARAARIELDGVTAPREAARDARGIRAFEELLRDATIALRGLRQTPGFTLTAISTLSAGLLLATLASTVAQRYLLSPLPAPASDRLFHVWYSQSPGAAEPGGLRSLDWHALSDVVEVADASIFARYVSPETRPARELVALRVSRDALHVHGLTVVLGRAFVDDDFASAEPPLILGHHLWQERFGGRLDVLGTTLALGSTGANTPPTTFRVIGVARPGFRYVREFSRPPVDAITTLPAPGTAYMVRLRPHVSIEDAGHRITDAIRATPGIAIPTGWSGVRLESVHERYVAPMRPVLSAVWLASLCVLALVTANVAILVLLRGLKRQREAAVRVALGASRSHLMRSLAVEGALVGIVAAALGLTGASLIDVRLDPSLAAALGRVAPAADADTVAGLVVVGLVFTCLVAIGWVVLGSIAVRQSTLTHLRDARTSTDRPVVLWARFGLLSIQMAASVALLTGCAIMIRSASDMMSVDLGMKVENGWRSRLALPASAFPDQTSLQSFYERLTRAGHAAGLSIGYANWPLFVEAARPQDLEVTGDDPARVRAAVTAVTSEYLDTLGIPTLDGRSLLPGDRSGTEPVVVVSASFAARTWPGQRAVGQQVRTVEATVRDEPFGEWRTVVGVVGDVRQMPGDEDRQDVYIPFLQRMPPLYAVVVMRPQAGGLTARDVTSRFEALSAEADHRAIVGTVTSLSSELDKLVATPRLLAGLLTGFGGFAIVMTMIGLYGTLAHAVAHRETELAIRLALGASRDHIARLLLGATAGVLLAGGVAGAAAAASLGRLLSTQVFQNTGFDPVLTTLVVSGASLCGVLATLPAVVRATRIAPASLLRS